MITTGLAPICILLTVQIVNSADSIGDTFLKFKNDTIHGINVYGTDIIGVLLDKEVYIGKINDRDARNVTEIARIYREEYAPVDYPGPVLEFKLIDASNAFVCIGPACCVDSLNPVTDYCFGLKHDLKSASAALFTNGIMLHTANAELGSIEYLVLSDKKYIYSGQISVDGDDLSEFITVAGFATDTHSYFVGSLKHLDLPMQEYYGGTGRNNTDIKISRVCNNDKTPNLASRIDLVLSCEGIDYNTVHDSVTNRATAALYLPESSKLLVAFQHDQTYAERSALYNESSKDSTTENYICSYNFTELQSRFTETWDKCQSMPETTGDKAKCKKWSKNFLDLDEECYLFSWDDQLKQSHYCSAYNGATDDTQFDNCELHSSNSTSNYGSITNFKPYEGNLVFREYQNNPIVALQQLPNEEALYALRNDNELIRIRENTLNSSDILKSVPAKPGESFLQVLPNTNKVLFVPAHSNNTISAIESSCEGIYKTCQSIAWNDPLKCLYCANEDGSGTVVSDKLACPSNVTYQYVCPPIILNATETEVNTYLITGIHFDKFLETPEVTVCESSCNLVSAVEQTSIHCSAEVDSTETCVVKVTGSLNTTDSKLVNVTLSKQLQGFIKKPNNKWKKVLFIFALIGLFVIICICFWRQYGTILKRKLNRGFEQAPLDMLYNPTEES